MRNPSFLAFSLHVHLRYHFNSRPRCGAVSWRPAPFTPSAYAAGCASPATFPAWLQAFKKDAIAQGISPQVVSEALDGLSYDPAVIAKDRGQGVFAQSFLQFSGRMVNGNRLSMGSALLKRNAATFAKIQQQYGVPGPVLVGFWGLETDFGKVMGNMDTLRSLATLAFDCRRPDEFREQLMDALRVIQRGDLTPSEMHGPWAGEVGQFQFVPTVYYKYAVDFDGDGTRNLISDTPDALASAANYLKGLGWQPNQPWIEEVRVPANLPWDQADVTIKKPRAFWAQHGVTYANGKPIPTDNVPVAFFQYWQSTLNANHTPRTSVAMIGHQGDAANHEYDITDFWDAVNAHNMPAVSFLKARAIQDGHAGYSNPFDEQIFLVNTINALRKNRRVEGNRGNYHVRRLGRLVRPRDGSDREPIQRDR